MDIIYHILPEEAQYKAKVEGEISADSLAIEGFIHCSRQDQLLAVANRFFADVEDVSVAAINAAKVASTLVYEGPRGEGDPFATDVFPHVYSTIPWDAVIIVVQMARDDKGAFMWPKGLPRR